MRHLIPNHSTIFDEELFLSLLEQSLCLDWREKSDILNKVKTLSQFQIDNLIIIFRQEQEKFDEVAEAYPDQVNDLRLKAAQEWEYLLRVKSKPEHQSPVVAQAMSLQEQIAALEAEIS